MHTDVVPLLCASLKSHKCNVLNYKVMPSAQKFWYAQSEANFGDVCRWFLKLAVAAGVAAPNAAGAIKQ